MIVKQPAVIVDRDGTLARIDRRLVEGNNPDWESFNAAIPFDTPIPSIVNLTKAIRNDWLVLITTGRNERFRPQMTAWLNKHSIRFHYMFMRGDKDNRSDDKVKRDIFHQNIEPFFDVQLVVDDRPSVCQMWLELGLPLIQVTQPEDLPVFSHLTRNHDPS